MKTVLLARLVPNLEGCCIGFCKPACNDHFNHPPPFASQMTSKGLTLSDLRSVSNLYLPKRGALSRAAGPSAEQMGDSETGESANLLVRESGAEAPAWPAKRSPAEYPC